MKNEFKIESGIPHAKQNKSHTRLGIEFLMKNGKIDDSLLIPNTSLNKVYSVVQALSMAGAITAKTIGNDVRIWKLKELTKGV